MQFCLFSTSKHNIPKPKLSVFVVRIVYSKFKGSTEIGEKIIQNCAKDFKGHTSGALFLSLRKICSSSNT